ncbi:uncharacterized protein LOC120084843 [Benincasa hispida]|uniref:uncharacterized protein LOC120084843 n=1 Tax=Benincasa hispida TaxID=102211 RepID=UPI001901186A|nr:uncharacterized protein LOC120084843 [Benincasa hispida]
MEIGLTVKNKLGFINGEIPRPFEISASINFSNSAQEIWADLQEWYQRKNRPRVFQLCREISNLSQNQDSVTTYYGKLKMLWNELISYCPSCSCGKCTCGGVKNLQTYFQTEYVMAFLMGLNDSSAPIRSQLLLMEPEPSINRAFSLVAQEIDQKAYSSSFGNAISSSNVTALLVKNGSSASHQTAPSYSRNTNQNKKKDKPICTHCNIQGHTIDHCYKLHGYPPGHKLYKPPESARADHSDSLSSLTSEQCQGLLAML